ncbi:acyl-CoA dehydrogenase family protein [Actinoplanes palleronii]|uniref:Acyl-CoA dehydrogenase n=1 Tax=Actinoplanes palleronii TaxID=113570 RepID=A0ABQ4BMG2_9ACTN|nr:acyl-CoA dehydrogenase family protein [Actinoplanes palleronii]GIE71854.1 acyl-CoA dehydrogenase [Actinoplanes palleronii]
MTSTDTTYRILRDNAEQTENQERLAPESLKAAGAAGAFALRTPMLYGGAESNPEALAVHLAALARACPSTAWIAGTCATSKTFTAASFPDAVLAEFHADPDAVACGSGVPAGRGERVAEGVRVTGRWPNVSGCEDAAWAGLALMVDGAYSLMLVPVADLTVDRTWRMAGMRGTGSHTLVATDLLVPAERVAPATPPAAAQRLLYALTVLGPVVGAATGALDVVTAMFASDRKPFMTGYARMGDSPGARQWLADATHLVDRARSTMLAVARAAETVDAASPEPARLAMDMASAARDCRSAVDLMLDLHGASGFAAGNPLQRYWRDVAVGSRHPHLNPYLAAENLGTALLPS